MLATSSPFPQYFNLAGQPLTAGKLYFGTPNLDPRTSPIAVFWDAAGTIPAAQPIRTLNGYTARNGTPAPVFVSGTYSLLVHDKRDVQMAYAPYSLEWDAIAQATAQVGLASGYASAAAASAATAAAQATAAANAAVASRLLETDVATGFYTPTISNITGVTITARPNWVWLRIKNHVTVAGFLNVTAASALIAQFRLLLPIATTFAGLNEALGGVGGGPLPGNSLLLSQNPGNGSVVFCQMEGASTGTIPGEYSVNLSYKVIGAPAGPPGNAVQGVNFPRVGATTFTLNADGTSSIGVNWHTNPAANIGASYWVRATRTGGTAGSAAPATFTSLAAGAIISISPSAPMNGILEFSRSAGGTPIEATSMFAFT